VSDKPSSSVSSKKTFEERIHEAITIDGEHIMVSSIGEEIMINSSRIDLECLVNMTSSLLRYAGVEYSKYLKKDGETLSLENAIRTIAEGTIATMAESDLQEEFDKTLEEI